MKPTSANKGKAIRVVTGQRPNTLRYLEVEVTDESGLDIVLIRV